MPKISPIKPHISIDDSRAVLNVLNGGYVNDGSVVRALEDEIGKYHDCECIVVSNATQALEIIIGYFYQDPKECISVPKVSHLSTVHAPINAGIKKMYCKDSPILAVDLNGRIGKGGPFADSSQSILTYGIMHDREAVAISLGALKTITAGVGGAILTKNSNFASYVRSIKAYGLRAPGAEDTDISGVGSNYRMSDINAALALSQWSRKEAIIYDKWRIYEVYRSELGDMVPARYRYEVPWLIECDVSQKMFDSGIFRRFYKPFGAYPHLKDYIVNFEQAQKQDLKVFLPSWCTISDDAIKQYAELVVKGD